MTLSIGIQRTKHISYSTILDKFSTKSGLDNNEKNILKCGPAIRNSFHNNGIHIHKGFLVIINNTKIKFEQDEEVNVTVADIPLVIFGGIEVLMNGLSRDRLNS
jgi:hypothetical protein